MDVGSCHAFTCLRAKVSSCRFWISSCVHLSGRLQSRATDLGSCQAFTCWGTAVWAATASIHGFGILSRIHLSGGFSLEGHSLEPRILDFVTYPVVWGLQSQGQQFRATDFRLLHASLAWRLQSDGLQSRATDLGYCHTFICLGAKLWGAAVSKHGFGILSLTHLSWGYSRRGYSFDARILDFFTHSLA